MLKCRVGTKIVMIQVLKSSNTFLFKISIININATLIFLTAKNFYLLITDRLTYVQKNLQEIFL